MSGITLTRLPGYDVNGNPRYVCHYSELLTEWEKYNLSPLASASHVSEKYARAIERSHKIGGRKYNNKHYGGGIVFQSYATEGTNCERMFLQELEGDIKRIVAEAEETERAVS